MSLYIDKLKEILAEKETPPLCFVHSFGCQQNVSDGEKILGLLSEAGYGVTYDVNSADVIIYNTCAVRENAEQRVYGMIGELKHLKANKPELVIGICGCMAQEEKTIAKIKSTYKQVDLIFGTHAMQELPHLLYDVLKNRKFVYDTGEYDTFETEIRAVRSSSFKASVPIMYGCNNFCSYCIVPYVRGREKSRTPEAILNEVKQLAADGYKEIMLLGQNVNSYGKNLDTPVSFAKLLTEVEKIEGIERIRFMTSHPKDLSDELIEVMKHSKKVCRHLHLPLQSGSTRILEKMNRRYTKESYLALVEKLRKEIPDLALTTDIIVGFPGETKEDVDETIDVVRKAQYNNAFTFIYSKRTGTPAAAMENQVPADVVQEQFNRVLEAVQETANEQAGTLTGQIQDVLVEEINEHDDSLVTGRLSNNTLVHFPGDESLIGSIVPVKLKEAKGFYYFGELMNE